MVCRPFLRDANSGKGESSTAQTEFASNERLRSDLFGFRSIPIHSPVTNGRVQAQARSTSTVTEVLLSTMNGYAAAVVLVIELGEGRGGKDLSKEFPMKISDVMTPEVRIAKPDQTLRDAARMMAEIDAGVLPVADDDRLIGMITDRDIAIRGVANGRGPDAKVREIMSEEVRYCFADQDIEEVTTNMADIQVRRFPVVDRNKRLVGIVSLGDVATRVAGSAAGEALSGISQPGGQHSQTG
jgi:CBS domain-containing protein